MHSLPTNPIHVKADGGAGVVLRQIPGHGLSAELEQLVGKLECNRGASASQDSISSCMASPVSRSHSLIGSRSRTPSCSGKLMHCGNERVRQDATSMKLRAEMSLRVQAGHRSV